MIAGIGFLAMLSAASKCEYMDYMCKLYPIHLTLIQLLIGFVIFLSAACILIKESSKVQSKEKEGKVIYVRNRNKYKSNRTSISNK